MAVREESIGARISQLRKDKGMIQKELAERLEVSQPVVSDYENDVIRLPADIVGKIAQVLEVTSYELLGLKRAAPKAGCCLASNSHACRKLAVCLCITQSITLPPASQPKQCQRFVLGETMQLAVSSPACHGQRQAGPCPTR